jgi:lysophospholipase L1-like esterase
MWTAIALSVSMALTGTPAAAARHAVGYVALGDSSAAGPLIPNQIDPVCYRSDHDWPHQLAARLGAALTDVTCSGARTTDLEAMQCATVAPQYGALRRDTGLVTIAIGANDLAMGAAFVTCAAPARDAGSPSCREQYSTGGHDVVGERIRALAPLYGAALAEIHRRSPHAEVISTGYLTYWQRGGCYPADPFRAEDADFIQQVFDRLHAMLAAESARHGVRYVDIRGPSAHRGLCEPPARRWLEGAVPASPAYPYHPNAAGMAAVAHLIRP